MIFRTLIKYFFASVIILFIIWNRFFRVRDNISTTFHIPIELFILFDICLIFFFLFVFYTNIKKILNYNKRSKIFNYKIIVKIREFIQEYVINSPEFIYIQLTKNKDLKPFLELPGSYFTVYCNYPRIITIVFLILPLIIIATCFLFANLFYSDLTIFFKSLILLIPMLFMRLWLFILTSYSNRRLIHVYQFINVSYVESEKQFKLHLKEDNQLPNIDNFPIEKIKQQFPVLCNFWEIYSKIYSFMKDIDTFHISCMPYVQVYTSVCYIIGWSFYLLLVLY